MADYESMVVKRGTGNVHFCGCVSDTRAYMAGAEAFVLASLADLAPLVLSEAREAELAVVASRVNVRRHARSRGLAARYSRND